MPKPFICSTCQEGSESTPPAFHYARGLCPPCYQFYYHQIRSSDGALSWGTIEKSGQARPAFANRIKDRRRERRVEAVQKIRETLENDDDTEEEGG